MTHPYTVATPHGDVHLNSEHHHSAFASIEDFLEHHKTAIMAALGTAGLSVASCNLYMSHFRAGTRLK